jgi:formate dehydrogenase (NADP+) alpha subunit
MAEFLTIDGRQVEFEAGMTILQAASRAGIEIPNLCYQTQLPHPQASCRVCVVEVEGAKSLVASCAFPAGKGLVVHTASERARTAQRMALELMLSDHPADCLSCEEAGACRLQEWAYKLGAKADAYPGEKHQRPVDDSNPFFERDYNKCIACGNCVQACSEVERAEAITEAYRGFDAHPAAPFNSLLQDKGSTCTFCGSCVQVCPTGALVSHARKGRGREWELKTVITTCPYCGTGCTLELRVKNNKIVSVRGHDASPVNLGWLCVKGRFGMDFVNSPERLTTPLIKRNGKFEQATWDEALDLVASKFAQYKGEAFACIGGARCSNEENYLIQKFTRAVMGTNNVDNCARLCHAPTVTGLSKAFGTGGGTNPLSDLQGTDCIFVVGSNTTEAHPVAGRQILRAAQRAKLIVADPRGIELARQADIWLPQRPGSDVALLCGMAKVIIDEGLHDPDFIAARCGNYEKYLESLKAYDLETVEKLTDIPKEKIVEAARLYAQSKTAIIVYSLGITEHSHGTDNVLAIANLAMITGNVGKPFAGVMPMRGQNNVQGACDMGCVPGAYQGYQAVNNPEVQKKFEQAWGVPLSNQPGLYLVDYFQQALEGKIKALYCMGMDPAYSVADINKIHAALEKMEFVVVQDIFLSGSAKFADVVLPGVSFAEKYGTFTNLERRVQLIRKAIDPVGDSRPDWWIICELARRMGGKGFDFDGAAAVMEEIARLTPSFAGVSFDQLEKGGIQWPCLAPDHPGTCRLHAEKFNTPSGRGHLADLEYRPPAESPDEEYPFLLTTGRSRNHFHLAMTSQVPGLMKYEPEETLRLDGADAARLGIKEGELVKVISRRGEVTVKAKITDDLHPGLCYMTFHFYETPTNVLTNLALDPVSKTPEFKVSAVRIEKLVA